LKPTRLVKLANCAHREDGLRTVQNRASSRLTIVSRMRRRADGVRGERAPSA
jgi:hypothetical protein